eukprot:628325-Amphidinium_carterae.4
MPKGNLLQQRWAIVDPEWRTYHSGCQTASTEQKENLHHGRGLVVLPTEEREAALGWARDAGRAFKYDVREVLGLTGVPGQNGWKEQPQLPRDWPPQQLTEAGAKPSGPGVEL